MFATQNTIAHRAFGVEQEHFVFHADGSPPTHSDTDELWRSIERFGYRPGGIGLNGQVLSVERDTSWGPLVVTNDSCTHIVEVAFPKMYDLCAFTDLYVETWSQLIQELVNLGLSLRLGGSLPAGPAAVHWRPKESDPTGERLLSFISRPPIRTPSFTRHFRPVLLPRTSASTYHRNTLLPTYSNTTNTNTWFRSTSRPARSSRG